MGLLTFKDRRNDMKKFTAVLKKLVCLIFNHDLELQEYIDSHGNDDSIFFCKRCKTYF